MIWGGRLLERLGKQLPSAETYGESWEVSDHPLARSVVAEGPWAGTSLRHLMERNREELLGPAAKNYDVFPWLFKFLDARDWLSVQVHPDEHTVKKLWPGEGPKNEAWFVLDAQPGSRIYAGLLPGMGAAELRAALARSQGSGIGGRKSEVGGQQTDPTSDLRPPTSDLRSPTSDTCLPDCLYQFEPKAGDFLFLPAGTVHAVGGGVLFAEIQQTSDATFRLFDWNRVDAQGKSRKLHVEEAVACIDWTRGPTRPLHVKEFAGTDLSARVPLAQTLYFNLSFVRENAPFAVAGQGRLQAWCIFSGRAHLATGEEMCQGQVWLMPAAMPASACRPEPSIAAMICELP
jgi:mannose-6-phosphate isomerase